MNHLRDLFLLDPSIIFLNHGSFGACPRPVFQAYQAWQLELERQPVEFLGRRFSDLMREARTVLADYVHAVPEDLVYVPNATTAVNVVAHSLPLKPGDEVVATDHEYGAMDRTWRFLCAKRGATYRRQILPTPATTAEAWVDCFWEGVSERTKVLFFSHITSPTALILPVREICQRARQAGIWTVVDGAHAGGQIPLDLVDLGVDFYTSNAHKWMQSAKGSAFLYARREVQRLLEPLVVSWGWEPEKPGPSRFVEEQEWQGTRDIAAYLSVPSAIRFMAEHHWEAVQRECHELARYARARISELTGLEPLSPDSVMWYAQMVTVPLPPCDPAAVKRRLYEEYHVEVPLVVWKDRPHIRVSIQAYNVQQDVDTLIRGLAAVLK